MAKNYRGKTTLIDEVPLFKFNSKRLSKLLPPFEYDMYIDLMNVQNLDLSQFELIYPEDDVKKEHPYYFSVRQTEDGTYPGIRKDKIKLPKNGYLTFYCLDTSSAGKTSPLYQAGVYPSDSFGRYGALDPERFSCTREPGGAYPETVVGGHIRIIDPNSNTSWHFDPMALVRQTFDGNVRGIPPIFDRTVEVPGEPGKQEVMRCGITSTKNWSNPVLQLFRFKNEDTSLQNLDYVSNCYLSGSPTASVPGFSQGARVGNFTYQSYIRGLYSSGNAIKSKAPTLFSYLYDGKDLWMLSIILHERISQGKDAEHPVSGFYYVSLFKVVDNVGTPNGTVPAPGESRKYLSEKYDYNGLVHNKFIKMSSLYTGKVQEYTPKYEDEDTKITPEGGEGTNEHNVDKDDSDHKVDVNYNNLGTFQTTYILRDYQYLGAYANTIALLRTYKYSDAGFNSIYQTAYAEASKNMLDGMLSVCMLPFNVPEANLDYQDIMNPSVERAFCVGGYPVLVRGAKDCDAIATGDRGQFVKAPGVKNVIASFSIPLKCNADGSNVLKEHFGNFLDYSDYTTGSLYLPYIGTEQIALDLLYGKALTLQWNIDVTNGNFVVKLLADGIKHKEWRGCCGRQLKISTLDNSAGISSAINRISSMGAVAGSLVSHVGQLSSGRYLLNSSKDDQGLISDLKMSGSGLSAIEQGKKGIVSDAANFSRSLMMVPPNTGTHLIGGTPIDAETGFLDSQNVTLTVQYPNPVVAEEYEKYKGHPSDMTTTLRNVPDNTFVQVSDIHLRCRLSYQEQKELEAILKEGFII